MIKFLKKFKDKILIVLACSFIGIGTLLNNTIETKAYNINNNNLVGNDLFDSYDSHNIVNRKIYSSYNNYVQYLDNNNLLSDNFYSLSYNSGCSLTYNFDYTQQLTQNNGKYIWIVNYIDISQMTFDSNKSYMLTCLVDTSDYYTDFLSNTSVFNGSIGLYDSSKLNTSYYNSQSQFAINNPVVVNNYSYFSSKIYSMCLNGSILNQYKYYLAFNLLVGNQNYYYIHNYGSLSVRLFLFENSTINVDYFASNSATYYSSSSVEQLQTDYEQLQSDYNTYQSTHAYTNEQYDSLMFQNASLSQQVLDLQNQYNTYVSLHTYTNEQYNTLLTNYNNLQNMYSNLQANYLVLQQQYESLALSVAPFTSSKWNNRTGSLNGVTYDLQTEYRDSFVSFEKTYLYISPRDLDVFENYSTGSNTFVLTAYCNQHIILNGFNVIANLSHLDEESFQINFYLDNSLVYSTIDFDNDMGEDDSNTISVDRFLEFNQITVTVIVNYDNLYNSNGYFNAVVGTWQDGYDYAVGKLMPEINRLEDDLQRSNSQQQVKYNEGYNKGISDSNSQPLYGMVIRIL